MLFPELVKHEGVASWTTHKVSDLNRLTTNLKVNWRQLLNDQLLKSVSLKEDDEVDLLNQKLKIKEAFNSRIIADAFVLKYLYQNRFLFDWCDEQNLHNINLNKDGNKQGNV